MTLRCTLVSAFMPVLCMARAARTTCSSESLETDDGFFGQTMLQRHNAKLAASAHMSTLTGRRSSSTGTIQGSSSSTKNSSSLRVDKTPAWKQLMSGYDHMQRPHAHGEPERVNVSMTVEGIVNVDQVRLAYTIHGYLKLLWRDPRLKLPNATKSDELVLPTAHSNDFNIWTPNIFMQEAIQVTFYEGAESLHVYEDGVVEWTRTVTVDVHCKSFDFGQLPFDVQHCGLTFGDYLLQAKDLVVSWVPGHGFQSSGAGSLDSGAWKVIVKSMHTGNSHFEGENHSVGKVCLQFTRRSQVQNGVIFVALMLVVASYVCFWVPATAAPARTGLSSVCFLMVLTNLQAVQQHLPPLKIDTDVWMKDFLLGSTLFCFSTLVEYGLVSYGLASVAKKKAAADEAASVDTGAHVPDGSQLSCKSIWEGFDSSRLAQLDDDCHYLYPVFYLIFVVCMAAALPYYSHTDRCS